MSVIFRPDFTELSSSVVDQSPVLTVVIDTEEEFDWSGAFDPAHVSTRNIGEQYLAQTIFGRFGLVPTYAVDYPVATDVKAAAALRTLADADECEIGAHLHPWVTPPNAKRVRPRESYPGNLVYEEERAKLAALTAAIETAFGRRPYVYKAGRYGLGSNTARILEELGYRVDVSVVPYTDFSQDGGPDYSNSRDHPVRLRGNVIGLPLSVGFAGVLAPQGPRIYRALTSVAGRRLRLAGLAARLGVLERLRLSPEGHSAADMIRQVRAGLARGGRVFMMTYHSSSLLPGATPYVRSTADRERFLATLDHFLEGFFGKLGGTPARVEALAASIGQACVAPAVEC